MIRRELVAEVADKTGLSAHSAQAAVDALLEVIVDEVAAGRPVILAGFGTFEARDRAARTGRNPRTGEPMEIAAARVPVFKPGAKFRAQVDLRD
ncbi:DNA-binding protein HU-beta [Propionicimonas paludicola]|uniref:DNA-binding protein HU-beta n=1 Tax=Propionicimonas paludicola TaxID=185243 RepID=A0A2A9CW14_9ACTN|nr:HU family DNA-binding protein [Propionicimonas paludicola]PFG17852.1 DNA-binding protein HU-beta [Propionicimonas paludicola]